LLHSAVRPTSPSFHRPGDHVHGSQSQAGPRGGKKSQTNRGECLILLKLNQLDKYQRNNAQHTQYQFINYVAYLKAIQCKTGIFRQIINFGFGRKGFLKIIDAIYTRNFIIHHKIIGFTSNK